MSAVVVAREWMLRRGFWGGRRGGEAGQTRPGAGRREHGQALVELVATAPLVLLCALLSLQALAAGAAYVYADNAAHVAALAGQLGGDTAAAARAALPGWSRGRVRVAERDGRVTVTVRPRALVPPLARLLTARASAVVVSPPVTGLGG